MRILNGRSVGILLLALLLTSGCFSFTVPSDFGVESRNPAAANLRRETYVSQHTSLSPSLKEAILKGELVLGMIPEEVAASFGEPDGRRIRKGGQLALDEEIWFYYHDFYHQDRLIFDKGKLSEFYLERK